MGECYLGGPMGARIETGSYVGTGVSGSANPNSLTFGFEPKIVHVFTNGYSPATTYNLQPLWGFSYRIMLSPATLITVSRDTDAMGISLNMDWLTTGVKWYVAATIFPGAQMNILNTIYNYIAIG